MIIKINKIFGKYNSEINLNRKLNIFIGENGIGKSTSVKILNCLFKFDYIGLLDYYFDNIEIKDKKDKIVIKYSDLMISNDILLKDYINDEETYSIYKDLKKKFIEKRKEDSNITQYIYDYIIKQEDYETYQKYADSFSAHYDFDAFLNEIDNRLLNKILKMDDQLLKNEKIIQMCELNGLSTFVISFIREEYANLREHSKHEVYELIGDEAYITYFSKCNIGKKHKKIKNILEKIKYNDVYLIDMVSNFKVTNDLNRIYANNELETKLLKENESFITTQMGLFDKKTGFSEEFKDIDYCNKLSDAYIVLKDKMFSLEKDSCNLDFGYILFKNVYSDKMISEFQDDFYGFINEYVNDDKKIKYKISDATYNKIKLYLRPLLSKDNVIGKMFDNILFLNNYVRYEYADGFNFIGAFYNKYQDKYFDIKNEKLELLNKLFKKYFINKNVIATPFGISISSKDYMDDINYKELSAGEKKIIILFMLIVFSENEIILLDEPEASLSVVWQKELIKDIITNCSFNKLVVATQSPYIVSNDEFIENLVCLPMEDSNE